MHQRKPAFSHSLRSEYLNIKHIFHVMSQDKNDKTSKVIKGNRLCVKFALTVFYPTDTLPKLKVHKAYIPHCTKNEVVL